MGEPKIPTELIPAPWTVREAAALFVVYNGIGALPGHRFRCWMSPYESFADEFGDSLIDDLTTEDISGFVARHARSGSPPSARCALKILLQWVEREGGGRTRK